MTANEKVTATFQKNGFKIGSRIKKSELQQMLNSIMRGEVYDIEVIGQIWEQSANGASQVSVQTICNTFVQAQAIVQNRLIDIHDEITQLKAEISSYGSDMAYRGQVSKLQAQILHLEQERGEYEQDLRLLTEPFSINPATLMSRAISSRNGTDNKLKQANNSNLDQKGNEVELKWLLILSLALGVIEVVVIFKKYDFLNLIVFACLVFIFLMNHFDSLYINFVLILLMVSEVLDSIWLFMNSSDYWSPASKGTNSGYEKGYLKLIILLTYVGIFLKIPLGVFLFHYRNVDESKNYDLDIGVVKFSLTSNKKNPISDGISKFITNN